VGWRRARGTGALARPDLRKGRPAADPRDSQISRLQKENQQLGQELAKARLRGGSPVKLQALLEALSEGADSGPGSSS
jgi:hypothetical protein